MIFHGGRQKLTIEEILKAPIVVTTYGIFREKGL